MADDAVNDVALKIDASVKRIQETGFRIPEKAIDQKFVSEVGESVRNATALVNAALDNVEKYAVAAHDSVMREFNNTFDANGLDQKTITLLKERAARRAKDAAIAQVAKDSGFFEAAANAHVETIRQNAAILDGILELCPTPADLLDMMSTDDSRRVSLDASLANASPARLVSQARIALAKGDKTRAAAIANRLAGMMPSQRPVPLGWFSDRATDGLHGKLTLARDELRHASADIATRRKNINTHSKGLLDKISSGLRAASINSRKGIPGNNGDDD